jgi:hypothetical protein
MFGSFCAQTSDAYLCVFEKDVRISFDVYVYLLNLKES